MSNLPYDNLTINASSEMIICAILLTLTRSEPILDDFMKRKNHSRRFTSISLRVREILTRSGGTRGPVQRGCRDPSRCRRHPRHRVSKKTSATPSVEKRRSQSARNIDISPIIRNSALNPEEPARARACVLEKRARSRNDINDTCTSCKDKERKKKEKKRKEKKRKKEETER